MVGQQKQSARSFDAKIYERSDAKTVKVKLLNFFAWDGINCANCSEILSSSFQRLLLVYFYTLL